MPRPRKTRTIDAPPRVAYFKPWGVPMHDLEEVGLPLEGFEALRLADLRGLTPSEASARMGVSRHTYGRVLRHARRVVATAVVHGLALRIDGGQYTVRPEHGSDAGREAAGEEAVMAKVAVSSEGPSLDDRVDPRFGRAGGFVIVETDTLETSYVANGAAQVMTQGAGIQAAETVVSAGAKVVLTGYVGPRAFQALSAAGVRVGQDLEGLTVRQAVERYKAGAVAMASAPNRQGHGR